jgi:hypothetical protein
MQYDMILRYFFVAVNEDQQKILQNFANTNANNLIG